MGQIVKHTVVALCAFGCLLLNQTSILFSALTIPVFYVAVLVLSDARFLLKVLFSIGFIILNDVLIRLKYWGHCDMEGLGWQMMVTLVGSGIVFVFVLVRSITNTEIKRGKKMIDILLFLLPLVTYFCYFSSLGMICDNNATEKIEVAKERGLFIAELFYSDSLLIHGNDTFKLGKGWIEYQTVLDHTGLIRKNIRTGNYNWVIPIKGKFDEWGYSLEIHWKNDSNANGSGPLQSVITGSIDTGFKETGVYFFVQDNSWLRVLKEIRIHRAY